MGYTLDLTRYEEHFTAARRRRATACAFQEPDCVPICISEGGSYWSWMLGVNIRDYYTDMATQVDVQLRGMAWRLEQLRDDRITTHLHLDLGPVGEALAFDMPVVFPDGTSPRAVPILETVADIDRWQPPDPADNPRVAWYFRRHERFVEQARKLGSPLPVAPPRLGIHPPLSAACAVMEPATVYELMILDPPAVHRLHGKLCRAFCRLVDWQDERFGTRTTRLGLADDNTCFISNTHYREFVLPYNRALYDRYGQDGRTLHADGPSDQHFRMYAEDLHLTEIDIGGFSSMDAAVAGMKGRVFIHGSLNCKDVYGALDAAAKAKVDHMLAVAAPGGGYEFAIGGETYPGVPPETLHDLVEYVRERGRYPITLKA